MSTSKNDKLKDSLDNLFDAFSEVLYPTKEQMKEALSEEGIDPDKITKEGVAYIKKLQARTKMELAKKEMLSKVEAAKLAIKELVPKLSANHKEKLAHLLFGEQAVVSVNFNKLNELSDTDIIDMLDEVQLLEFLESLKKKS